MWSALTAERQFGTLASWVSSHLHPQMASRWCRLTRTASGAG